MKTNSSCDRDGPSMDIRVTAMHRSTSPLKHGRQLNDDLVFEDTGTPCIVPSRVRRKIGMGSHVTRKILPITTMGFNLQNVKQKQMPFQPPPIQTVT